MQLRRGNWRRFGHSASPLACSLSSGRTRVRWRCALDEERREAVLPLAIGFGRNVGDRAAPLDSPAYCVRVCNPCPRAGFGKARAAPKVPRPLAIGDLAACECQRERTALCVCRRMDFGRPSPARATDRLVFLPPFRRKPSDGPSRRSCRSRLARAALRPAQARGTSRPRRLWPPSGHSGCRGFSSAVFWRSVNPATAGAQHIADPAAHATIVHPRLASRVRRLKRLDLRKLIVRQPEMVPIYQRFLSEAVNHKPDIMPTIA